MAASLHSVSFLCCDFDIRNLIGVREDDNEHVLVTCKGVVKRYNILDRKQVGSWAAKTWDPFSAPVISDPIIKGDIIGVINGKNICQWSQDELNIDKVKRVRFCSQIFELFVCDETIYVIYSCGYIQILKSAILSRKASKPQIISENETIASVQLNNNGTLAYIVVNSKNGCSKLYKIVLMAGEPCGPAEVHDLVLPGETLKGFCVLTSNKLVTLWSNGFLHIFDLDQSSGQLPGPPQARVVLVKPSKNAKILELSITHLVIIGMDKLDDGGVLLVWDMKFGLTTSHKKLKMYRDPPLSWVSPSGIIVADGGSLGIVPYTVAESNLATVFGSKARDESVIESEMVHSWNSKFENQMHDKVPKEASLTVYSNKSIELCKIIRCQNLGSITESMLVGKVVKHLMKHFLVQLLEETVTVFQIIPEFCLIDILLFYMQTDDSHFLYTITKNKESITKLCTEDNRITSQDASSPFSYNKARLINGVLSRNIVEEQLLQELSRINFQYTLHLIQHLHFLIVSGEAELNQTASSVVPSVKQASLWFSLLLDTNYHQLVMTSEVPIHHLLLSCLTDVKKLRMYLEGLEDLHPLIQRVVDAKVMPICKASARYSIERLHIT